MICCASVALTVFCCAVLDAASIDDVSALVERLRSAEAPPPLTASEPSDISDTLAVLSPIVTAPPLAAVRVSGDKRLASMLVSGAALPAMPIMV